MRKFLLVFLTVLLFGQHVMAQKSDTLLYFLKNNGDVVADKTSADYIIAVLPPDTTDANLYIVNEYFVNGKAKIMSKSTVNTLPLHFQGQFIEFFQNGHKRYIANYLDGALLGEITMYYPNGKPYAIKKYSSVRSNKSTLIECRDSTGNTLCTNGNGQWISFDKDFKNSFKGPVVNGLENGTWEGKQGDSITFTCVLKNGELKSGISYDKTGKAHTFNKFSELPTFGHGTDDFRDYITRSTHYPEYAREHNLHETVQVSFIVEKDGTITDVKVVRGHIPCLKDEAVRVVTVSPNWSPGKQFGIIQPITLNVNVYF